MEARAPDPLDALDATIDTRQLGTLAAVAKYFPLVATS